MFTMVFRFFLLMAAGCAMAEFSVERVFRASRHFRTDENIRRLYDFDDAAWYGFPANTAQRFRCDFNVGNSGDELILDVTADNRYILKIDGREIGRGPHRGFLGFWQFSSYRIAGLRPGSHRIEATVWHLSSSPLAQIMSVRGAFALRASGAYHEQLTTGRGRWKVAQLTSVARETMRSSAGTFGAGGQYVATGTSAEFENPPEDSFKAAGEVVKRPVHNSVWGVHSSTEYYASPSPLPEMMHEPKSPGSVKAARSEYLKDGVVYVADDAKHPFVETANRILAGERAVVPPGTSVRFVWDLGNYYCAFPYLKLSGGKGAHIRWGWAEALYDSGGVKQSRSEFANRAASRLFADRFISDGRAGAEFSTYWWRCGRWCQIEIKTAEEPLTVEALKIFETRYPMVRESSFECDDRSLAPVQSICARAMEMCSHEMFFDCPYYEQQMYGGDSRTQFLTVGSMTRDDRHIRHALRLFDESRRSNGLPGMNTPTRGRQDSVTYALIYPIMLADYMRWHDNREFLAARLGGMRQLLSTVELFEDETGVLGKLPGWSFVDWSGATLARDNYGVGQKPHLAAADFSYLLALRSAAEIERAFGNEALAAHWTGKAEKLIAALKRLYWDEKRGMFSDDDRHAAYSEHVQCLALLGDAVTGEAAGALYDRLISERGLLRTTVYFSYYLFETHARFGRPDLIFKALDLWRSYVEIGAATTLERPHPSRSDCHAWGAHPLHHLHASILGLRPSAPFFGKVRIAPQPGPLKFIKAKTPHPKGMIESDLRFDGERISGCIKLPEGVEAELVWRGRTLPVSSGKVF